MSQQLLPLRDYQRETLTALERAWSEGTRRPAVVLPTGAGKTVVFAHLIARKHEQGVRTLVIVHTNELIEQAVAKLHDVAPHMTIGVVKAERDEHADADAIVATVQTLRVERRRAAIRNVGLVVVDECHHGTAKSYRDVLEHFGCFRDGALAVGFTATLARGDGAALADIWQKVAYRRDILDMIHDGYLLPARGKRVRVPDLDLGKVRQSHGDYQADEMGDALTESLAPELVAKAYVEHASDRSGILFAPTVDSAQVFAETLNTAGISSETVYGALPREDRALILKRFRSRDIQVVCNCMVLTEGFDEPRASCCVIARPTTSATLYTQMVGRVLRPYPGQTGALVLDVVGVTGRHKLASLVDLLGDPSKRLRDVDEKTLADLLLTADGFEFDPKQIETTSLGRTETEYVHGETIEVDEVDLFARSHAAWLKTTGGVWMLPAGQAHVFLAPAGGGGRWNVAVYGAHEGARVAEFRYRRINLDAAMSWGEEVVRELGGRALVNRKGNWRKPNTPPSEAQKIKANRLGIKFPEDISKGDLSDMITVKIASGQIDPIVKGWTR
jgi:superfamily II DNA or RNA helicase